MPAQVSADVQHESRSLGSATKDNIRLISSMKALTKGRKVGKVKPANMPLKCWFQLLGADNDEDLL